MQWGLFGANGQQVLVFSIKYIVVLGVEVEFPYVRWETWGEWRGRHDFFVVVDFQEAGYIWRGMVNHQKWAVEKMAEEPGVVPAP